MKRIVKSVPLRLVAATSIGLDGVPLRWRQILHSTRHTNSKALEAKNVDWNGKYSSFGEHKLSARPRSQSGLLLRPLLLERDVSDHTGDLIGERTRHSSPSIDDDPRFALVSTQTQILGMDDAERAQKHETWLERGRHELERQIQSLTQLQRFPQEPRLWFTRHLLMLLTLEPSLVKSLRQTLNNLPQGTMHGFCLNFHPSETDRDCRNPPSEEALLATATELAHMMGAIDSLKNLRLYHTPASLGPSFWAACSRIEHIFIESCPLVTANVESMFSIKTLRKVEMWGLAFLDSEAINAFCRGVETCAT